MARTDDIKRYLANKHRGGENNQKGGLFEDFYAIYQIALCIARYKSSFDNVRFQVQLEDTFVDDMLIAYPEQNMYHQLKNTKSLSWGEVGKVGDIAFDFAWQINDCKDRDETFALKLVYSQNNSEITKHIPSEIKEYTATEYFDYSADINNLVILSTPFKEALWAIAPNGEKTPTDVLANIAIAFLGIWRGCDTNEGISLAEIIRRVENVKYVNLNIYPDEEMSEKCKCILDAFKELEYHISGKMFYWRIGCMSGCCPWSDEIEVKVTSQHPTDQWELMSILS